MNLNAARADALKAARGILDGAKADGRDLTDEEQATVEGHLSEVVTLDKQIKGRALVDAVKGLHTEDDEQPTEEEQPAQAKSLGEHFVKSVGPEQFTRLKALSGMTVASPEFKAATDPQLTTGAVYTPYLTEYDRTVVRTYRPGPVVADLLGSGTISGNAVSYFIEGAVEGAFTTVAEGAAKPQLHFVDPTSATDKLTKIAAWFDMSDEMAEDLPFMVSEINQRGLYMLSMFEEQQLLNGPGTGTTLRGLLNRSGIQTETQAIAPDSAADSLFRAMTKVMTATGLAADGIIINPTDYQALRLSKDGNGQYFGGGFFQGPYGNGGVAQQPPLWGLRTVVTSAVPAKTAVVGAFGMAATVYRKGGVRVEQTNSDLGKFTSNIITTRIEERIALAVRIPSAIVKVTLL
jgi:HK97 family phage major capsid protein